MKVRIEQVPAQRTWPLRQAVLRPHQTIADMALIDDDYSMTATFAALDNNEVIGTARVALAQPPSDLVAAIPEGTRSWQLRAMAVREDARNDGLGREIVNAVLDYVARNAGGLLWCNARIPALNFYRRAGFVEYGAIFEEPQIGPHIVMWRRVEPKTS